MNKEQVLEALDAHIQEIEATKMAVRYSASPAVLESVRQAIQFSAEKLGKIAEGMCK